MGHVPLPMTPLPPRFPQVIEYRRGFRQTFFGQVVTGGEWYSPLNPIPAKPYDHKIITGNENALWWVQPMFALVILDFALALALWVMK